MSQQQKPLKIQQDDKFFSRLLSKESSMAKPSSRVLYYADRPGSVPFLWESQPGTPKTATFRSHHDDESYPHSHVPPLTPPPSYYSKHNNFAEKTHRHKRSRSSSLLSLLFPKRLRNNIIGLKNVINPAERCSMLDHSATFRSGSTTTTTLFSSSSSSFDSRGEEEEEEEEEDDDEVIGDHNNNVSPNNSTLCFRCYRG